MGKKTVRIPMEEELIAQLDARSLQEGRSRAEVLQEACRSYLKEPGRPGDKPQGALAFVGAWGDLMSDEEIDQFIADIYAAREQDTGRPVDLEP